MSFLDCLYAKVKTGTVSRAKTDALAREYEELVEQYTGTMGSVDAAAKAAARIVSVKQEVIAQKIENDITHALMLQDVRASVSSKAEILQAEKQSAKFAKWIFGNPYSRAVGERLQSVYVRHQSLERMAHASIADLVEEFRSKRAGVQQDTAGFMDVVREMGGTNTGNAAAVAFGKSLRRVFDDLHAAFQDAGGVIGRLDNWFPQIHTPELVGRATFDEWKSFLFPLLDRERIIDLDTGLPMSDRRLEQVARESYESIKTNGLVDVANRAAEGKQTFGKGGEVSMRRTSARFFHFKNTEAFLEYNRRFGVGDSGLFDGVITNSAQSIARLHARAKPSEQNRRQMRPIREQDAEFAIKCVGIILCEIGWADWV